MADRARNRAPWRIQVLTKHLACAAATAVMQPSPCVAYASPEANSSNGPTTSFANRSLSSPPFRLAMSL